MTAAVFAVHCDGHKTTVKVIAFISDAEGKSNQNERSSATPCNIACMYIII